MACPLFPVSFYIIIFVTVIGAGLAFVMEERYGAPSLTASLDYGTFQGAYSSSYNISYWMKIPFAAPPVSENRFRAPQPPLPITNGTYNSSQTYDFCPQRMMNGTEDCLYLGIYSRPWSPSQDLRPVVVVFYGGGFIRGGGSFTLPPNGYPVLNVSTKNDFIFVHPNYRVNAFGFLPGKEIAEDAQSDLNVGLLDQQAALQWTQRYIEYFGGDPQNVSIWGQSAGGGSVVAQVIANRGKTSPNLFTKALASSPYWPKTYRYDAPEAQAIYDTFAELAGCSENNSLACLKAADVQTLRTAALYISRSHSYTTSSFTWAPVIDDSFLPQPLSRASLYGDVNIDFGFGMYNAFEGENFIPHLNFSLVSFETWLRGFLPGFSEKDISWTEKMYPENGIAEATGSYSTTYLRAQLIYRDVVLACPAYWLARGARKAGYVGQYDISPAQHASDTGYWNRVIPSLQNQSNVTYLGYTGAFASFFETGDPNAHKLTNPSVLGVPKIDKTLEEWVVLPGGEFQQELLGKDTLRARCGFWSQVAVKVPI